MWPRCLSKSRIRNRCVQSCGKSVGRFLQRRQATRGSSAPRSVRKQWLKTLVRSSLGMERMEEHFCVFRRRYSRVRAIRFKFSASRAADVVSTTSQKRRKILTEQLLHAVGVRLLDLCRLQHREGAVDTIFRIHSTPPCLKFNPLLVERRNVRNCCLSPDCSDSYGM
ncbi:hypothetical protein CPB85DRAFT_165564 [Mucidula mucida]|nr:hypothetical protein CPB85DRAFT_165564 [Mucidula mucida]